MNSKDYPCSPFIFKEFDFLTSSSSISVNEKKNTKNEFSQIYFDQMYFIFCRIHDVLGFDIRFIDFEIFLHIQNTISTNSFGIQFDDENPSRGGDGATLMTVFSFCNHSCEPNAFISHDEYHPKIKKLVAKKNIKKGEEILISYVGPGKNYIERKLSLFQYGFNCNCKNCLNEKSSFKDHEFYQALELS
jgi:hypothetical protein